MDAKEHYHLVGVAGVGMSPLAQTAVWAGLSVSGSDRSLDRGENVEVLQKLRRSGVRLFPQDGSGITDKTRGIVISTAIEENNADLAAAKSYNVPVLHRSQFLQQLVQGKRCIAVTGTSGKSTVTGMIGWILAECGKDPCVVSGAPVLQWMDDETIGSARRGYGDLWLIEADESDRSLLNYEPEWVVITNASKDHFSLAETLELFRSFAAKAKKGVVSTLDNPDWYHGFHCRQSQDGSRFSYKGKDFAITLPGRHNAEDALIAVVVCEALGCALEDISNALGGFRGIHRRLERVGEAAGVNVYDDFGHNPAKIRAALGTLSVYYKRLVVVWRPHGYGPLTTMMDDLVEAFAGECRPVDRIFFLPVYDAGGTASRAVNSDVLAGKLRARNVEADYIEDVGKIPLLAAESVEAGDAVIIMGAHDPGLSALARKVLASIR
jgi:UDP-N-acetylmuramate--alanine ligase